MANDGKNYFFKSFLIIALGVLIFFVFKEKLPDRLFSDETDSVANVVIDSLALTAMSSDSLILEKTDSLQIDSIQLNIYVSDNSEGFGNLHKFYEKLHQLESSKQGKVRVAYFGDSMTDGDLIVQDIRRTYQNQYGGKGVGFVGITSLSASARASITHQYSGNWITQSFLSTNRPKRPLGIDGQVSFVPVSQSSWLKFSMSDSDNLKPILYYGSSSNKKGELSVTLGKDSTASLLLNADNILNELAIPGSSKSIRLNFTKADSIPFYGVNIEDGDGVYVDNFSMRGNSGLPLSTLNKDLMNAFDAHFGYDLIIIHYGTNVLGYGTRDYGWYEKRMSASVNHLRNCFPDASMLIISTADRAVKYNMVMQTDKAVEPLVASQKKYAEATRSGFINLYQLMGGNGSMVKWVNESPSLANKDYTHFNRRGSQKIGELIFNELDKGYAAYKQLIE